MTLLALEHVTKTFGSTVALDDVSFELQKGEVHVLAGENGAGKSTLIRILAGADADYTGDLRLEGRRGRFESPAASRAAGIATIHQELSLVPALSVSDHFELTAPGGGLSLRNPRRARERAKLALGRVGLTLDPDVRVETLSLGERQLVEIARALDGELRVLVMDEPTSALGAADVARLLEQVKSLALAGVGIVYVSHRLNEIFRIADRVTVLRDGKRVLTERASTLGREGLVRTMLRHPAPRLPAKAADSGRALRLRIERLEARGQPALGPISLELGQGELVGVAGVEGSGASSLLYALFGDGSSVHGELVLDGERYEPKSPAHAFARGIALLAADRRASVLPGRSVLENATLSSLRRFSPGALLRRKLERDAVVPEGERVRLKAPSLEVLAGTLSGGNQQKVALLRCLLARPRLLLLDDPTRGIDLGARADVHDLLRRVAAEGTSVLFRSSDLGELVELSDRALVLFDGRQQATLARDELSEARLLALMMGGAA